MSYFSLDDMKSMSTMFIEEESAIPAQVKN